MKEGRAKKRRKRKFKMSDSKVMDILVMFHHSRYRDPKSFYLKYICTQYHSLFPETVSYRASTKGTSYKLPDNEKLKKRIANLNLKNCVNQKYFLSLHRHCF